MRASPSMIEDRMRACAYGFWFETYLGAPDFPTSEGLIPSDPGLRRRYIDHQIHCEARWRRRAQHLGGAAAEFKRACIAVRAAWLGHGDPLMRIRGLASALSDFDLTERPSTASQAVNHCNSSLTQTKEPLMETKILVAIDNSPCSSRALDEAIREATLRRAFLEILHVIDYGFLKHDQDLQDVSSIRKDRAIAGRTLLKAAATRVSSAQLEHAIQLIDDMSTLGDVAGRILKYVRDSRPDLVVVGSHGKSGLTRAVLGSVADQLVRHCPVPVLIVRQDMLAGTPGFGRESSLLQTFS